MRILQELGHTIVDSWREVRQVEPAVPPGTRWRILLRFMPYLWPYRFKILGIFVCSGVAALHALVSPLLTKFLLDRVLPEKNLRLMAVLLLGSVVLWGINNSISLIRTYLDQLTETTVRFELRRYFFEHMQKLSLAFFDSRSTGEHMYRADTDIAMVVALITKRLPGIMEALFHLGVLFAVTAYMNWGLTLVSLTLVPMQAFSVLFFSPRLQAYLSMTVKQQSQINTDLQEAISSIRLVKAFGKEEAQRQKYCRSMWVHLQTYLKSVLFSHSYNTLRNGINVLWSAGFTFYCGYQVMGGILTVGEMMALMLYVTKLHTPISSLIGSYTRLQQDLVPAQRVLETLDLKPDVEDAPDAVDAPRLTGAIRFQQVSFGYQENRPVLRDLSFSVEPGSIVALVGPSGAGKSTIASLILRLYDPWEGRILLDGLDLKHLRIQSVREQIGMVLQDNLLLPGSVADNLRFAREEATDEEIVRACEWANAHAFIEKLPEGYATDIAEKGVNLSGGQRQRLALARAFIKEPALLILDEPSSYQDPESERWLTETLWEKIEWTTLIIAHRLSTIRHADKLLMLDEGRIVEEGTHAELTAAGGPYARMYGNTAQIRYAGGR